MTAHKHLDDDDDDDGDDENCARILIAPAAGVALHSEIFLEWNYI